tara:strand:+ start:22 stop:411 length:390 start_codon:yes stop_codon:yes gene_type:complete
MNKNKYDYVWDKKMKQHLPQDYELECISLYRNCFDYSPIEHYDEIMVFVTKAFIERNRQLGMEERRHIAQVKMKWGYLTIYYDGGRDPYLDEIINTASKMAESVKSKLDKMYGHGGFRRRKVLHTNENR